MEFIVSCLIEKRGVYEGFRLRVRSANFKSEKHWFWSGQLFSKKGLTN